MKCNGAQLIVNLLERQGIQTIFGIPGGANLPIYDALYSSKIKHVLARHEQGAGFMAQGMARSTGRAAVCMATSGPGAANLITAIADAKLDSVPLVAITGQVPASLMGTDAFQEVDTYGLTLPVTKHNFLSQKAGELLDIIPEAFQIAESGRPGPVVIDVPKDVQTEIMGFDHWPNPGKPEKAAACDPETLAKMADMIHAAHRPVCYIGGGVIAANASELLRKLVRKHSIPVAATLMGLSAMAHDDPLFLGMLGMHGNAHTNVLMDRADLIIALGIRFDDRATGKLEEFCSEAAILHVDVDPSEIGKLKNATLGICGDVYGILSQLVPKVRHDDRKDWQKEIAAAKPIRLCKGSGSKDMKHPADLIRWIGNHAPEDAIITTDVGQHQMWTARTYPFKLPRTFLTSGGLGTMGFGLPAAMGAAMAHSGRKILCFTGDGSFLMNIQELATLAELHLNITIILLNNGHLGLVRQQQELFYKNHIFASRFESSPDFAAIARGFGISASDLSKDCNPENTLKHALETTGPWLINAPVHPNLNVFPMVPPGASNLEMIGGNSHV
jgi:acetolactate synthase-1/2/3 large subunit